MSLGLLSESRFAQCADFEGNVQTNDSLCDEDRTPELSRECEDPAEDVSNLQQNNFFIVEIFGNLGPLWLNNDRFANILGLPRNGVHVRQNAKELKACKPEWFIVEAWRETRPSPF